MSKDKAPARKSVALIELTSGLQLTMTAVAKDGTGAVLEMNASLSRIEAQHLADALLEYSGVRPKAYSRGCKTTFTGTYSPDFKEHHVVRLNDARSRSK